MPDSQKPHRELVLWQKAVSCVVLVYQATRGFPPAERFGLAGQMRRAAVSIPSNVAEGAARRSRKEYLQFLYTARGSLSELDTQLEIALQLGYVTETERTVLQERLDEISRMLHGMIMYLAKQRSC